MKVRVKKLTKAEQVLRVIKFFDIDVKSQGSDGVIITWDASRFMVDGCISTLLTEGIVRRDAIKVWESELGEMFSVMAIHI